MRTKTIRESISSRKRPLPLLVCGILLLMSLTLTGLPRNVSHACDNCASEIWHADFETGDFSQFTDPARTSLNGATRTVSSANPHSGTYSEYAEYANTNPPPVPSALRQSRPMQQFTNGPYNWTVTFWVYLPSSVQGHAAGDNDWINFFGIETQPAGQILSINGITASNPGVHTWFLNDAALIWGGATVIAQTGSNPGWNWDTWYKVGMVTQSTASWSRVQVYVNDALVWDEETTARNIQLSGLFPGLYVGQNIQYSGIYTDDMVLTADTSSTDTTTSASATYTSPATVSYVTTQTTTMSSTVTAQPVYVTVTVTKGLQSVTSSSVTTSLSPPSTSTTTTAITTASTAYTSLSTTSKKGGCKETCEPSQILDTSTILPFLLLLAPFAPRLTYIAYKRKLPHIT